ncbi:MAG: phytanoyl-CoA dioxygenase [Clostridia bacterium]|nr:phytanoyl-CoA dioxygenase [Clostridia bacterium]
MEYKEELRNITGILLEEEDHYGKMKKAVDDLYRLFQTVSGLEENNEKIREDIFLPSGKAIGSFWAAACIKELVRTKRYLRGVYKGIKQAQTQFPGRQIHILYAGTGPFAALAVPLTTVFASSEIKFTLLEINTESIRCLKRVIKSLQLEDYIYEIVQCDAAEYRVNRDRPVHMIITETMQNALKKEPQVAITMNLAPQMEEGGILVPECVFVSAALLDLKMDMDRIVGMTGDEEQYFHSLGEIFQLDKDIATRCTDEDMQTDGNRSFPWVEVDIPEGVESRFSQLCLFTAIRVFGGEELKYRECSLTMPLKLFDRDRAADKVAFRYVLGDNPGFEYRVCPLPWKCTHQDKVNFISATNTGT